MNGLLLFSSLLSFVNVGSLFVRLGEDERGKVWLGCIGGAFKRLGKVKVSEVWFGLTRSEIKNATER